MTNRVYLTNEEKDNLNTQLQDIMKYRLDKQSKFKRLERRLRAGRNKQRAKFGNDIRRFNEVLNGKQSVFIHTYQHICVSVYLKIRQAYLDGYVTIEDSVELE